LDSPKCWGILSDFGPYLGANPVPGLSDRILLLDFSKGKKRLSNWLFKGQFNKNFMSSVKKVWKPHQPRPKRPFQKKNSANLKTKFLRIWPLKK
jgi:hypothetical protein